MTYAFRCPVCANVFRSDEPGEPCCTGPSWQDDHEMTVMRLLKIDRQEIDPIRAEARASGPLLFRE